MPENDPYRLPRTVAPRRYDITLSPDLKTASFAGEVRIEVDVLEPVEEIVLNALELEISAVELRGVGTGTVALDEETERATLTFEQSVEPGAYTLDLSFTGTLNDKLRGFYRSTFTDDDGNEQVIATTQFESTDARRAFPCWDEPDRKAVFGVTLVVEDGLTAVSNSPVVDETVADGKRSVQFSDTMKMSTYLVAFVVGPLETTPPVDVDGTPLRVLCVPGKSNLAGFALDIAAHSLRYFARYFGIAYPGEKLDLIALPDFAMGAMENLGAVTFRENLLLIDPERATRGELERVSDVVAHEVAHMWFGDLVTMKWWNGIWLNEAFATFMELLCVDDFRPDWDRWVTFGLTRGNAMVIDSLASTRPIEFPVRAPEEAEGMFDVLTYQKGGGVLRMLEQYLGAEPFRNGIVRYIDTHQYGNTETTDLWDAIEAASGEPARATMDTWIFQGGYPVVSVEAGEGAQIVLSQRRFRYVDVAGADDALWRVPVLLRASVAGEVVRQRVLLSERETTVELPGKPDWVVVNAGGHGVYRVRYTPELLRAITTDLAGLDKLERFALVSDTWASVLAGTTAVAEFVELLRLFKDETDPAVWGTIGSALSILRRVTSPDDRPKFHGFVSELARPQFERLGWEPKEGESELDGELRGAIIGLLGWHGADEAVLAAARELHERYLADTSAVDPNVADVIATLAARTGGEAEFQTYLERWRNPTTPQETIRYLYNLADFPNPGLARRALDLAITEVRTQNGPFLIALVLAGPENAGLAWEFIEEHWDEMLERFTPPLIPRMLETVSHNTDAALAARVRTWMDAHPLRSGQQTVDQAMERMDVHVTFRQRVAGEVGTAFDD